MERIKKFEPLFGEWYAEALISEDENERVYRVYREKDGQREYRAVKHVPVPNDESIVDALREGGMDEETLTAYSESRLRDACREIAMMGRLGGCETAEPLYDSAVIPRESGFGSDVFILTRLTEPLSKLMDAPADEERVMRLAEDISAALAAFEKQGISHRNISPETVRISPDGGFCLGGFAGARVAGANEEPAEDEPLTYAAPEVIKGEAKGGRADIYSLGLMLYQLTNGGRMPFEPENATPSQCEKAAFRRMAGAKLPAPENAGALEPVIMKATEYDPAERFASAEDMAKAVKEIKAEAAEAAEIPEIPAIPEEPEAPEAPAVPVIPVMPVIPTEPEAGEVPDLSEFTAPLEPGLPLEPELPQEPLPTAPKEPVTPVIGSAAFPVIGGEPMDKKAAKKAEKARRREEKRLKKEGAALPPDEEYEEELEEEFEDYELTPREEKRIARERMKEEKRLRKMGMLPEEEYEEDDELVEEPRRGGLRAGIIAAAIIAGLALIGILGLLGKKLWDDWNAKREESAFKPHAPEILRDAADPDVYRITIYAENGTPVVYENTRGIRREYSVNSDNRIVFELRGSDLIPDEPLDSTAYSVQPKFYTRGADQTLQPIADMGYIMLEVPEVVVTMDCGDTIETEDGHVVITGHVETTGAELYVDSERMALSPDGNFKFERDYEMNGEYEVAFEAKLARCCTYKNAVKVVVNIPEPPAIMLPWDLGDTRFSQRVTDPGDTINVHGSAAEGSTVTVSCDNELVVLSEPIVGQDGAFMFTATLPEVGDYLINITATDPAGVVSTREMHLQRAPEWRPYVESAWAMSYDALTRPSKQCYNIKGTVTEIIEHTDRFLVVLETEDGNTLLLEYHHHYASANTFVVGKQYNWIYGFPMGRNSEGAPVVYVWFVNDK